MVTCAPPSGRLRAATLPPSVRATLSTRYRPNPWPGRFLVDWYGVPSLDSMSGAKPGPRSVTVMFSTSALRVTARRTQSGEASRALSSTLKTICCSVVSDTMGVSAPNWLSYSNVGIERVPRHSRASASTKVHTVVCTDSSPRASPADSRMPLTMLLQRCTWACISRMSSCSGVLSARRLSCCQSPRITARVDSGVPSSCAAPEASSPMRTMCSSSTRRRRAAARRASRSRRFRLMRVMNTTTSVALSTKHTSRPSTYRLESPWCRSCGSSSGRWCVASTPKHSSVMTTMDQM